VVGKERGGEKKNTKRKRKRKHQKAETKTTETHFLLMQRKFVLCCVVIEHTGKINKLRLCKTDTQHTKHAL
jgi:hypothetical protein